jgi:hypothetical protein
MWTLESLWRAITSSPGESTTEGHEVPITRWQQEQNQRFESELERLPDAEGSPGGFQSFVTRLTPRDQEIVDTVLSEAQLHYEFVPGLEAHEQEDHDHFFWYWMLQVSDDVGTVYRDDNGGTLARSEGGSATHGTRDLGGRIPDSASRLTISFEPPRSWVPVTPIHSKLEIDLVGKQIVRPS